MEQGTPWSRRAPSAFTTSAEAPSPKEVPGGREFEGTLFNPVDIPSAFTDTRLTESFQIPMIIKSTKKTDIPYLLPESMRPHSHESGRQELSL